MRLVWKLLNYYLKTGQIIFERPEGKTAYDYAVENRDAQLRDLLK